jgi:hypothetical protein
VQELLYLPWSTRSTRLSSIFLDIAAGEDPITTDFRCRQYATLGKVPNAAGRHLQVTCYFLSIH